MYIEVFLIESALRCFGCAQQPQAQGLWILRDKITKSVSLQQNKLLMTDNLKQSSGIIRILLFLVILLISGLIGVAASAVFIFAGDTGMKIGQGISSIFMFVVPPIVYYFITRKEHQMQDLGLRRLSPPWWLILIGAAVMLVSIPVTTTLTTWNESMNLGGAFTQLEE